MKVEILGQGYEATSTLSVGNQLIRLFADRNYHTFTGISAFTSYSGIKGLSKHIKVAKNHLRTITIVTGVDQKGTSKEALEELLALDINSFVFYQPSITIFHPKLYLFEGLDKSELIIGSSNLTSQGLFTNIEASLLVQIDNSAEADLKVVEQLKDYFKGIFDFSDPNLKKLSNQIIADLVEAKIVLTEAERSMAPDKDENSEEKTAEIFISRIFPKRAIAKIPVEFRNPSKPSIKSVIQVPKSTIKSTNTKSKLLWESGALTQRDLNIPKGSNTNPTGSMLFKKGKTKGIDQRHYFRDTVFSNLDWIHDERKDASHLERATAFFKIIIDGNDCGDYELTLTHNTRTDTPSYQQKNSMTSISWGQAKKVIAKDELIGKNAKLFKNKGKGNKFTLIID
jgi:HKD family nuclease